jgi:phosphatidylglycerol:prolipoprotein diacylglycerol transferase
VANSWPFLRAKVAEDGFSANVIFGGMHAGGAVIGLVIAAALVLPRHRVPALRFADAATPAAALGMAFGRFACFLNGCCCGTPCTAFWCLPFPAPSNVWDRHRALRLIPDDATWSAPVHPLQLYFTAAALAIMAVTLWLEPRKRHHGQVACVALVAFAVSNALLEPFRQDFALRAYWFGVPQLTWVAWGTALAGLIAFVLISRGDRRRKGYTGATVAP